MITWGTLTCLMAVVTNFTHLVVLRVIIGCVEAGFAPGVLLVLSSWYKRTEQSKRFGVYISAAVLSGAFGGLIAAGIVHGLEGAHGIRGWRWLFIIEGAATIGFAIISLFILPDFPATSRRLSEREKEVAIARLATENVTAITEDSEHLNSLGACKVACKEWRTWAFVIGYMVCLHHNAYLQNVHPSLTRSPTGHRRLQHPDILLPNPRQRPLRQRLHRESQPAHSPHLRRGLRRHRLHILLQRQSAQLARSDHRWLAPLLAHLLHYRLRCVQLHGPVRSPGSHGCWAVGHERRVSRIRLFCVCRHASAGERCGARDG